MAGSDKSKESLRQYLAEANGWETDAVARANRSAKLGWIVGFIGLATGLCAVIAIMGLTPLKQVVPVVIRVDNATGITEVVEQLTNAKTNYQEAINRYFLQQYVRYREGFNRATAAHNYTAVGLMSVRNEQTSYAEWFTPRNPTSPLNTHGEGHRTEISIRSTSFLNAETALVRFIREQHQPGMARPILSYWAATITFTYQNPPTSQTDREINPLGFQVTGYRVDPESLTAVEGAPAPQLRAAPQPDIPPTPAPPMTQVQVNTTPAIPQTPVLPQEINSPQPSNGQAAVQQPAQAWPQQQVPPSVSTNQPQQTQIPASIAPSPVPSVAQNAPPTQQQPVLVPVPPTNQGTN